MDEGPCNCLGCSDSQFGNKKSWIEAGETWTDWYEPGSNITNPNWVAGSDADPNGDNWRDCGWDGICPGDDGYESEDPNDTELNGIWDSNEGFEENDQYNFDILTGTGEYFDDLGNEISDESAEYYFDGDSNGEYDLDEPFEDRNCNEKWDASRWGNFRAH